MHPAKHLLTRTALTAAAVGLATACTLVSAPAHADSSNLVDRNFNIVTKADDGRSVGRCQFKVSSVDVQGGTATGRLSSGAQGKLLSYSGNVEVGVICLLRDAGGTVLAERSVHANHPYILQQGSNVTVPRLDGYELCTAVSTQTGSGQIFGATNCTNSF